MHRFTLHATRAGLALGVLRAPRFRRVLVQLFVHAGSRFENLRSSGSTHLLEHVLFRGTERHPTRESLEETFHRHQVDANAYTDREWVSIHLAAPRDKALRAVALALEIGFRPRFLDVEVERRIIDAEIRESRSHEGLAHERIGRLLWGDHPLGFPVAGRRRPATSRKALKALHGRFFRPLNSILFVAGRVDPTAVRRTVNARLAGLEPGHRRQPPPPPGRRGPWLRSGAEPGPGLRVVFHLQVMRPLDDRERLYLWVIGRLLEQRLTRVVREDRGACYDLYVEDEFGDGLNAIAVHALVRKPVGPMLLDEIVRQWRLIREDGGEPADLETVRSGLVRAYRLMEDDLSDLLDFYARQALLIPDATPIPPARARRLAERIDRETVASMARRLLAAEGVGLVLLARWSPGERQRWRVRFRRDAARIVEEQPRPEER